VDPRGGAAHPRRRRRRGAGLRVQPAHPRAGPRRHRLRHEAHADPQVHRGGRLRRRPLRRRLRPAGRAGNPEPDGRRGVAGHPRQDDQRQDQGPAQGPAGQRASPDRTPAPQGGGLEHRREVGAGHPPHLRPVRAGAPAHRHLGAAQRRGDCAAQGQGLELHLRPQNPPQPGVQGGAAPEAAGGRLHPTGPRARGRPHLGGGERRAHGAVAHSDPEAVRGAGVVSHVGPLWQL
jgi:hypothetical protein